MWHLPSLCKGTFVVLLMQEMNFIYGSDDNDGDEREESGSVLLDVTKSNITNCFSGCLHIIYVIDR